MVSWNFCTLNTVVQNQTTTVCADLDGPNPTSSCWTLKARALYSASCSYRSKWKLKGWLWWGATVIGINGGRNEVNKISFAVPSNVRFHLWPCWCCRKFHLMSSSCGSSFRTGLRIGLSNALQADGVLGHLQSGLKTPVVAAKGKAYGQSLGRARVCLRSKRNDSCCLQGEGPSCTACWALSAVNNEFSRFLNGPCEIPYVHIFSIAKWFKASEALLWQLLRPLVGSASPAFPKLHCSMEESNSVR